MEKVNLVDKLALFTDHWRPKFVGELNGQQVKRAIRDRLKRRTCFLHAVSKPHGREEARGRLRLLRAFRI